MERLLLEDGAATLTRFSVESIAMSRKHFPETPMRWFVCGGGRHNVTLMTELRDLLGVTVEPIEAIGWDGDAIEAQAFAFLACRTLRGMPISFPETTGVSEPQIGGILYEAA
ncbi:MAG: anhydro-N-acetylmuramic acid kinase [Candidatus Latescibacterota bacterium]